jgi:hypothetical protein
MVKAAREEEWTDNRIMLASAAFMTRVDVLRPTVTPEQVEAAAQALANLDGDHFEDCGDMWQQAYRRNARAVFTAAGLSENKKEN